MFKDYIVNLNDFKIIKFIDKGECSNVHLVQHNKTRKLYVAKEYKVQYQDQNDRETLINELTAYIKARNPLILPFYGFSENNFNNENYPTIITEYMPKGSLKNFLDKSSNISSPYKYNILFKIAEGMQHLHSCRIIHRDLKPGNILLDDNFNPYICDFGVSKFTDLSISSVKLESFVGSPAYMAPEIINDKPYTYKVDVYSFSIIAYELLTGKNPYPKEKNAFVLMNKVLNGKRPNLNSIEDEQIKMFLSKWWSDDPSERPSFATIINDLKNDAFRKAMNVNHEISTQISLNEREENTDDEYIKDPNFRFPLLINVDKYNYKGWSILDDEFSLRNLFLKILRGE